MRAPLIARNDLVDMVRAWPSGTPARWVLSTPMMQVIRYSCCSCYGVGRDDLPHEPWCTAATEGPLTKLLGLPVRVDESVLRPVLEECPAGEAAVPGPAQEARVPRPVRPVARRPATPRRRLRWPRPGQRARRVWFLATRQVIGPYGLATAALTCMVVGGFAQLGGWGWWVAAVALLGMEWRVRG